MMLVMLLVVLLNPFLSYVACYELGKQTEQTGGPYQSYNTALSYHNNVYFTPINRTSPGAEGLYTNHRITDQSS